ncbi:recombinase family protein [Enterococcus mediterraneensis]|uniref:recombinase family protein n=1 Tax=Enterococcus mediterraneensis TaxID=2364791 RepID=UPI000F0533D2|nr:recombinase family protein [Enterococcus mediterraneensis]
MKLIGYARTTINDAGTDTQTMTLSDYGCDKIFLDSFDQDENQYDLENVLAQLESGDTLVVCDLHRLGRSTRQLTDLTREFQDRGINLVSLAEKIDTREPMGEIYFRLMDGLANMECALIKERTLVGLNNARKKGKIGGRPKIDPKIVKKIRRLYYEKKETIQYISAKCGVSVGTCYKYINLPDEEVLKIVD